jgi:dienelactone hydrolase
LKTSRRSRLILTAAIVIVVLLFFLLWQYYSKDYGRAFITEKGALANVSIQQASEDSLREKLWLTLKSTTGLVVECGMLLPRSSGKPLPAIILLGGKATGKYAINYVPELGDVIVVAVDYPYEPRESYTITEFIGDVPAIRTALMAMVPSAMLLTDYLVQRPDVDSTRIVILGYSFGAPFVPCILATDRRPAVAAMVFGGGEMYSLIEHNVRRYEGSVASKFVGLIGGFLLWPLEPLRYADKISPVPLIMINGTDDEMIPRANVEAVFTKAMEPKKLIWLRSGHVRPEKVGLTNLIVATLDQELRRLGILRE